MNLANRLTLLRITLAPVFFMVYLFPVFFPSRFDCGAGWTVPVLWFIFIISQLTDIFDGMAARRRNETSDFGKLFDPFADTLMQITCFLCFVINNILPAVLFLIIIYREFCILFVRNLMLRKGIAMGARLGGKIKTVFYVITIGIVLLTVSLQRLNIYEFLVPYLKTSAIIIFSISAVISVISFLDYLSAYRKADQKV